MLHTTLSHNKTNRANAYLTKEILEASPQKLLLKIYDFAIANCKAGNMEKTNKAINELINALRYDDEKAKEVSIGLLKLYQFCQEQMRKGDSEIVYKILTDLRNAWETIFQESLA
ncbi:MAG: flagellar export chaperone FliS [Rhodothermaceae bacterium]